MSLNDTDGAADRLRRVADDTMASASLPRPGFRAGQTKGPKVRLHTSLGQRSRIRPINLDPALKARLKTA